MKTEYPLISVIIPAYNAEATIRRAADSVLKQSYPDVELVVVNDGSKDSTRDILEQLAAEHPNFRCIHQENGGVSKARNTGLAAAAGEYIAFLDADDEMLPNCLEMLFRVSEKENCDIVAGPSIRVRPDGSRTPKGYGVEGKPLIWQGDEALQNSLKDHPATYSVWGKLYRREVLAGIRFVEGKRIHEDSFFLFQAFGRELRMAVCAEPTIYYYMTAQSASRSGFSDKFLDILYFAEEKAKIVEERYPEYLPLAKNVLAKANMALLKVMCLGADQKYLPLEKQCCRAVRENAPYFIPAIRVDKILFAVIRLRLFWLYKRLYQLLRR